MHTYPPGEYEALVVADRWKALGQLLLASGKKLVSLGADLLICPDNTVHQGLDLVIDDSPVRWIHIAEEVARAAAERGFERVGILGTRWLMEGPVYPSKLSARRIQWEIPEAGDRSRINDVIMKELIYGRFESPSRQYFVDLIDAFKRQGCDAVVLGCTEIPLLISESDSSLPTLDSTRILARAALSEAMRESGNVVFRT
jgi:aspartate racemase